MNEVQHVSVVIPTRNRSKLLLRAIRSVLEQTHAAIEIVVVLDGPDDVTEDAMSGIPDPRVRLVSLAHSVGGGEARNVGIRAARGEWIALLDDDDEWLPEKIASQLAAVAKLPTNNVIVSCKYIERSIHEVRTFPARMPNPKESLQEYLCYPRGFRTGGEVLQTSTLLATRSLFLAVPFVRDLKRGQDFMWLIQASALGCATFCVVPEILSIFNSDGFTDDRRISSRPNWRSFYECVQANRVLFTPSTYGYTVACRILGDVLKCRETFSVKLRLLAECIRNGSGSPKCILIFFYVWMVPPYMRIWLGEALRSVNPKSSARSSQMETT